VSKRVTASHTKTHQRNVLNLVKPKTPFHSYLSRKIIMKSFISTIVTAVALTSGFATVASAASFSEATEFSPSLSTLSRMSVAASAAAAAAPMEATAIPKAASTLSRDQVRKELKAAPRQIQNELTASQLN
jgi:hypothetical protein